MYRFILILFVGIACGCGTSGRTLELEQMVLCGDRLAVLVYTSSTLHYVDGPTYTSDEALYVLQYRLPEGSGQARLVAAGRLPVAQQQGPHPVWVSGVVHPKLYLGEGPAGLQIVSASFARADILQPQPQEGRWVPLRTWVAAPTYNVAPPFIPSRDGRYLLVTDPRPIVVWDTWAMRPINSPELLARLKPALEIEPALWTEYTLTQNLEFLVVRPVGSDRSITIDGRAYPTSQFHAVEDLLTGKIGPVPANLGSTTRPLGWTSLSDFAADDLGNPMLMYRVNLTDALTHAARLGDPERMRYTIRDQSTKVLHAVEVPADSGNTKSWDAKNRRVLFYSLPNSIDLHHEPLHVNLWDYQAESTKTFSVDVESAFRKAGKSYELR